MIANCADAVCRVRFYHQSNGMLYRFLRLEDARREMCANPACCVRFYHQSSGMFYRFLRLEDARRVMERFWLCACCCRVFTLDYVEGQGVVLKISQEGVPAEANREVLVAA